MELNQNANEKFSEYMAHELNLKYGTRQVSSCLASPALIPFPTDSADGLQHLGSGLRRLRRQAAAVILSCRRHRRSDHEKPAGAEGTQGGAAMLKEIPTEQQRQCHVLVW